MLRLIIEIDISQSRPLEGLAPALQLVNGLLWDELNAPSVAEAMTRLPITINENTPNSTIAIKLWEEK